MRLASLLKLKNVQLSACHYSISKALASPAKICIVGAGPAGYYAAQHIVKALPDCEVDILERLPVPFGLVRFGVAPDHPEVKNVINTFTKTANNPRVRFAGNIALGTDVSMLDLKESYHAVLLTYGADEDKCFGIPGENLSNVLSAREFVGWYNGLPRNKNLKIDLSNEVAVILGQGNVAVDAARMLLSPVDELKKTDITEYALAGLAGSRVKTVYLVGRRGPLQVAFTIKELREMINLAGCQTTFEKEHFDGIADLLPNIERPRKRLTELLLKSALDTSLKENNSSVKHFKPLFMRSPVQFHGETSVVGVELGINSLAGSDFRSQKAVSTGKTEILDTQLVLRSIGYRSTSADPTLPFDSKNGTISNDKGRVQKGVYSAGWLSTGPVGVILSTMSNAFETGANIVDDIRSGEIDVTVSRPGFSNIATIINNKGKQIVSFKGWECIDHEERKRGKAIGKPREKITDIEEMLRIADRGDNVVIPM